MAFAVGNSGCVIGVPVEPKPVVADHRPVIEKGSASPTLGQISSMSGLQIEFNVTIEDDDLDDTLFVRLFRQDGGTRVRIPVTVATVPSGDVDHPNRRFCTIAANDYCMAFKPIAPTTLVLVVSDLDFTNDLSDQTPGLTDEAQWVLTCSNN